MKERYRRKRKKGKGRERETVCKSASGMKLKHEYETGNRCLTVKVTKATIVKKVVELPFVVP